MNHVIDLFGAAKVAARDDQQNTSGMALLLNFAMAYDSLGWSFCLAALLYLGLTGAFVRVVSLLNAGTRCRFSFNGHLSHWLSVSCGIWQGCPLAPLLFIFALDLFYTRFKMDTQVTGVVLATRSEVLKVKVRGYGDDKAV